MTNISRRGFVAASALTAGLVGLAGCTGGTDDAAQITASDNGGAADPLAAPSADKYPIDAEEWGSGTVRYATEVVGSERTGDGWTRATNEGGATVGVMDATKLIQVDGFAFKDTNGNGKLDFWEDWRQSDDERAAALAADLSLEEAGALMVHGSMFSLDSGEDVAVTGAAPGEAANLGEVLDSGARTMLNFSFAPASAREDAKWNNNVQKYVEATGHAIPVNISCNPQSFGFPTNLGLAATFEPELATQVAQKESVAYRAEGIATLLGPQIDVAAEPRWSRIQGTYGEDPALSRDLTNAYVSGLQSTYGDDGEDLGWGDDSVVGMIKHFPGDGPGESGREAHNFYGKYNVYPGNNYKAGLVPFVDGGLALDGATGQAASAMTSYSIAWSKDGEYGDLVGSGFSKQKIALLRDNCGWDGLICTDWGLVEDESGMMVTPWGVEGKTTAERVRLCLEAGVDQIGGGFFANNINAQLKAIGEEEGEEVALERAQESARRVLKTLYQINIMDNPYVSVEDAESIVQDEELLSFASDVMDKSIAMLKNKGGVVKDRSNGKPTVYVPMKFSEGASGGSFSMGTGSAAGWSLPFDEESASKVMTIVTDTLGEPSGPAGEDGAATYAESDVVRASADQIAACDYALVYVNNPSTGVGCDTETKTYLPVSLQYGEYVADGPNVRETSLAGDPADGKSWYDHGFDTSCEIENRSYLGKSTVATNLSDLTYIQDTVSRAGDVPVIVCVDVDRPMVFSEFEADVAGILMGFGGGADSFLNVASGSVEPSGLLPLQMPKDMDTVEGQCEDVPRDMECHVDSEGNEYDFAFGMDWSGVIADERVEKYSVEPLTEPETVKF